MTRIESKKVVVKKSAAALHALLSKFDNFKDLMPDAVTKFEADEDSFKFAMRGMPEVKLMLEEEDAPHLIKLKSGSSKIAFTLSALIEAASEDSSKLKFEFEGDFNPMLRMMVERPLKSFIEDLVDKIAEL